MTARGWSLVLGALLLGLLMLALVTHGTQGLLAAVDWTDRHADVAGLAFVACYVAFAVLMLPASLLTVAAGFLFGLVHGIALVTLGSIAGAICAFALGRLLLRERLRQRWANSPRLLALDRATRREGFLIVLLARLSPLIPYNLLNYALSLTSVQLRDYVAGSVIGKLPVTAVYVYLGSAMHDVSELASGTSQSGPAGWLLLGLGLAATIALTVLLNRWATVALREHLADAESIAAAPADRAATGELAVVIPVLDDTERLAELLARLRGLRDGQLELIAVAGAPDPALRALCARHACRYLEIPANRGRQLHGGACAARADTLWFLHADAEPHADSLASIRDALRRGAESGCFRFAFQGPPRWYKRMLAALVNLRVAVGGTPYGDQGIFVRRTVYVECGGFPHEPLFEEVGLIKRLRARRSFEILHTPIRVATRRWEHDGWLRRSCMNRWLALCHLCGVPAAELARRYQNVRVEGRP